MKGLQMPNKFNIEQIDDYHGNCSLHPLEKGYGTTLGNIFRRGLLSSLPGVSIIAVKIFDVRQKYSNIDGVKESVLDILLNLKKVRFKLTQNTENTIFISKKGPGVLTGKDINNASEDYEVINKDHVIATLADDGEINMEIYMEYGYGYVHMDEHPMKNSNETDLLLINAVFSPVKKVGYRIENVRVRQRIDYEKLIVDVETDGSIDMETAFSLIGNILIEHIKNFIVLNVENAVAKDAEDIKKSLIRTQLKTTIEDLNLSVRAYNCLKVANLNTVGDIVVKTKNELQDLRNFGKKSLDELVDTLEKMNLHLNMDINEYLQPE